jgi:hypothetical protein
MDQQDGHYVVGQHLPVVLAAVFDVDNENLLQPKGPLSQDIRLGDLRELTRGPVGEHFLHVQKIL